MEWNASVIELKIGVKFKKSDILRQSLSHRSYAQQTQEPEIDNERLELLGNAIAHLIIADYLYTNCPYLDASRFSALQDKLLEGERLTKLWFQLGLGDSFPFLGLSEDRYLLRQRRKNPFEQALRALVGAIHFDRGFSQARNWLTKRLIAPLLERHLKQIEKRSVPDKQLQFLGTALLKAIAIDYLYRLLPHVSPAKLTTLSKQLIAKDRLVEYLGQVTPEEINSISLEYRDFARKSFKVFLAAMYLQLGTGKSKDGFQKTARWFTERFVDDDEVLKTAIPLLLKEGKAQKWIIHNVMGYESKLYNQGRDKFNELIGKTDGKTN